MKKFFITLTALLAMAFQVNAMSYEQAREQALFLTDKMAYELNLTEDQYEAAFEINLDYLMSVESQADLYGVYWDRRNMDLSYILLDWQYRAYCAAAYFYRPLYWDAGFWHFGIYARYPHRTYFYFGRPHFYLTYRGGHSWHMNGGRSWYHGREFGMAHRRGNDGRGFGMRNGFDRGDYRNHSINGRHDGQRGLEGRGRGNIDRGRGNFDRNRGSIDRNRGSIGGNRGSLERNRGSIDNNRGSSTRSTVGGSRSGQGGSRSTIGRESSAPNRTFTPGSSSHSGSGLGSSNRSSGSSRNFSAPNRSSSSSHSFSAPSRSSGSSHSMSAPSRGSGSSFGGTRGGGGGSRGGGSFGGSRGGGRH